MEPEAIPRIRGAFMAVVQVVIRSQNYEIESVGQVALGTLRHAGICLSDR